MSITYPAAASQGPLVKCFAKMGGAAVKSGPPKGGTATAALKAGPAKKAAKSKPKQPAKATQAKREGKAKPPVKEEEVEEGQQQ